MSIPLSSDTELFMGWTDPKTINKYKLGDRFDFGGKDWSVVGLHVGDGDCYVHAIRVGLPGGINPSRSTHDRRRDRLTKKAQRSYHSRPLPSGWSS